jgi:hypothetical protein
LPGAAVVAFGAAAGFSAGLVAGWAVAFAGTWVTAGFGASLGAAGAGPEDVVGCAVCPQALNAALAPTPMERARNRRRLNHDVMTFKSSR